VRFEEKRRIDDEKLRLDCEAKLDILGSNHLQLTQHLQAQQAEFEEVKKSIQFLT
jgi:hypothetical protein